MNVKSKLNLIEPLLLILLAGFSISLFDKAGLILTAMLVISVFIYIKKRLVVDHRFFVLLLFSVFYFVTYLLFWPVGYKEVLLYMIAPWGSYFLGHQLVLFSNDKKMFHKVIWILVIGFFIHGVLNFYGRYIEFGVDYGYRVAIDFWRNELIAVTACALYYIPMICLAVGYLFFGKYTKLKLVMFVCLIFGMYANIVYENRTPVYILVILLILVTFSLLMHNRANFLPFALVVLGIAAIVGIWVTDFLNIKTFIMNLGVVDRIIFEDAGRVQSWIQYIQSDWWRYPFGGELGTFSGGYVHNMWLDTMYSVGWIPFLLLIVFTVQSIFVIKKFYVNDKANRRVYVYLIVGMTISCMVEPIIIANPYYFLSILMMIGALQGQNLKDKIMQEDSVESNLFD